MAFCPNCGTAVAADSAFCGNCGQSTRAGAPAPVAQAVAAPAQPGAVPVQASAPGLTSNMAGALAYILGVVSGIIFLVLDPYKRDRFVRFHAFQSIFYSVACIVFAIAWNIAWDILGSISGWLYLIAIPVRLAISLGLFLFWLFLMYQAYNNREFKIPFIGQLAAKQVG
ncbi:MAG TPA: zinc-ribbon domain-containing protein [Terriglobales bacterium]|nr:zinc-ribbon domain-containing protein [Terriglobales bacterium]